MEKLLNNPKIEVNGVLVKVFYHLHRKKGKGSGEREGEKTHKLAQDLANEIGYESVDCKPESFLNGYRMSQPDIVLAEEENKKAKILCEIEENVRNPKKIIGDVIANAFSEMVELEEQEYEYENLHILVGLSTIKTKKKANRTKRISKEIEKFMDFRDTNFDIVFEKDMESLKDNIIKKIQDILHKTS